MRPSFYFFQIHFIAPFLREKIKILNSLTIFFSLWWQCATVKMWSGSIKTPAQTCMWNIFCSDTWRFFQTFSFFHTSTVQSSILCWNFTFLDCIAKKKHIFNKTYLPPKFAWFGRTAADNSKSARLGFVVLKESWALTCSWDSRNTHEYHQTHANEPHFHLFAHQKRRIYFISKVKFIRNITVFQSESLPKFISSIQCRMNRVTHYNW